MFEGLDIWKDSGYRQIQGTYPVLYLSFASVKAGNVSEKMAYRHILTEMAEMDDVTACDSLNYLCRYLEHAYGKK